jgi:cytochrome c peroxidase
MQHVASISAPIRGPSPGRLFSFMGLGLTAVGAAVVSLVLSTGTSLAGGNGLGALDSGTIPQPIGGTITNQAAAIQLGKALFWDVQTGGDGRQACASCHFFAGEDTRLVDTVNPGNDGIFHSEGITGPGQTILRVINITNDDRLGSSGEASADFVGIDPNPADAADICNATPKSTVFGSFRQVTGRKAPAVNNAVFNRDNFWDGRANHDFNGNNPFGNTGNNSDGNLVNVTNSSLASQADGPPNNPVEMSCAGRHFNGDSSLGAKLLARPPLQFQQVSPNDSVLGSLANTTGKGLNTSYGAMIQAAFGVADPVVQVNQFSSFWGQAVQAYESTLISDQTPMDKYLSGTDSALTNNQVNGMNIFQGKGQCTVCHAGAEMTDASVSFYETNGPLNRDGGDQGFHNNGVRPTGEDLGRAGLGPNGVPWSVSGSAFDRGAFKTPGLRNVGLKRSFFHNGGKATLLDVVNFYNKGGDFANPEKSKDMKPLSLGPTQILALVDFLQNGLTDCRVKNDQAPFDHPALPLNNGTDRPATGGNTLCS